MTDKDTSLEDNQVLTETVFNEKIVTHPDIGEIKLTAPTLKIQRNIDAATRKKRKELLNSFDTIEDPKNPNKVKRVPSFKSKDTLIKEYRELGWWTEEQDDKIEELTTKNMELIAELELLGFESEEDLEEDIQDIRKDLCTHFEEHEKVDKFVTSIYALCQFEEEYKTKDDVLLRKNAESTEVDDLLEKLYDLHKMYKTITEAIGLTSDLRELNAEYSSLFSDSWQEQLSYYTKIAQLFYCTETVETGEPLWPSVDNLEITDDVELFRWAFAELSAFWQGLTDETREKIAKYSFTLGLSAEKPSSEDSPAPPESKQDGESQTEPESSSTVTDTQES